MPICKVANRHKNERESERTYHRKNATGRGSTGGWVGVQVVGAVARERGAGERGKLADVRPRVVGLCERERVGGVHVAAPGSDVGRLRVGGGNN